MYLLPGPHSSWTRAVLTLCCCGWLCVPSRAASAPAYQIALRLEVTAEPALTSWLVRVVRGRTERVFRAVLGDAVDLRWLDSAEAARLGAHSLEAVQPWELSQAWQGTERLLWVHLSQDGNSLVVQAREFDPVFRALGPLTRQRTAQRNLLPDAVARAVLDAFTPVAEVHAAEDSKVRIEFLGGKLLDDHRSWMRLDGNVGLQLLRETHVPARESRAAEATVRRSSFRQVFLALRGWSDRGAECELIGPSVGLFHELGSPLVRYLARPVRQRAGPMSVLVVRKETREPQQGCEVFISDRDYSTSASASCGFTDERGLVQVQPKSGGVGFVSVQYEDLVLQAPILPGASSDPLVFELPTHGRRAEFVSGVRQLYQELRDQVLWDNQILQELKQQGEARNIAGVRNLLARIKRDRLTFEEVSQRIAEIERRASTSGEDISKLASEIRAYAGGATQPLEPHLVHYTRWADQMEKTDELRSLKDRISEQQLAMNWPALVPLYERCIQLEPADKQLADQLSRLRNDLGTRGPEHEGARKWVDERFPQITLQQLSNRWLEIERVTETLLAAGDHLWLLKVRRSLNRWARTLSSEVNRLIEQIGTAADDPEEAEQLREQLGTLRELHASWKELYGRVQGFLGKLDL